MTSRRRIDVHQHSVPTEHAPWLRAKGVDDAAGRALPDGSAAGALEVMEPCTKPAAIDRANAEALPATGSAR